MERLQKYLAHTGVASRRKCEELILAGRVKINGTVVKELGTKVNPGSDIIEVDGKVFGEKEEKVYILLHKPKGYVTTLRDPQGRPKVVDLLKNVNERVYPVGRLDFETEGLLLLTNDGELTYALTHPKHEIGKTYVALVKGIPDRDKLKRFGKGLRLADGITAPAKVKLLKNMGSNARLEITIYEGRNRQIRRMCETIGHPVLELKRVAIGFLELRGLEEGKYRFLKKDEVQKLKRIAGTGASQK
ncbi:MAG: pseudouridine synthase [Firmicutes bacterium HGW-Firmicutes-14]|jgi:pseudouridine synthase|nr:MAG: pseudouridine synthase [Firmicutes bacterium HGW-Firmicutes-14]